MLVFHQIPIQIPEENKTQVESVQLIMTLDLDLKVFSFPRGIGLSHREVNIPNLNLLLFLKRFLVKYADLFFRLIRWG